MIKIELEVSDLAELTAKVARDQDEIRQAWREVDCLNDTIHSLRTELTETREALAGIKALIPTNATQDSWVNAGACRDLIAAVNGNEKIRAIKAVRTMTRLGLREAKDLVEEFAPFRPHTTF